MALWPGPDQGLWLFGHCYTYCVFTQGFGTENPRDLLAALTSSPNAQGPQGPPCWDTCDLWNLHKPFQTGEVLKALLMGICCGIGPPVNPSSKSPIFIFRLHFRYVSEVSPGCWKKTGGLLSPSRNVFSLLLGLEDIVGKCQIHVVG